MVLIAEKILVHCRKVRATGRSSWVACCPAHEDRSPSLSIRETPDGMLLLHCFAGCSVESIASACGVELGDLFPEKLPTNDTPMRKQGISSYDALLLLEREIGLLIIVAGDIVHGREVTKATLDRINTCRKRLEAIKVLTR